MKLKLSADRDKYASAGDFFNDLCFKIRHNWEKGNFLPSTATMCESLNRIRQMTLELSYDISNVDRWTW